MPLLTKYELMSLIIVYRSNILINKVYRYIFIYIVSIVIHVGKF